MSDLVDVEVLHDRALNMTLEANGWTCRMCGDDELFALLIFDDTEEVWPVCGTCFRNAPLVGQVVS